MAWRGVHLSEPCRLSLERNALKIESGESDPVAVPLEDLGWVIVDTPRATLTSRLVAACAEADVAMLFVDGRHLPVACLMPRAGYHRQLETLRAQLRAPPGVKGRLWKIVVERKLANQAAVLEGVGGPRAARAAKACRAMARRVRPGDPDNIEGLAAQSYWPCLFPGLARRDDLDGRNGFLNYGYAVVRALIARELAALGFEPSLGIHHANELNPFNLADDLIEPFRPFVDRRVRASLDARGATDDPTVELDKIGRRALAGLPGDDVTIDGERLSLIGAVSRAAATLRAALRGGDPGALSLPALDEEAGSDGAG